MYLRELEWWLRSLLWVIIRAIVGVVVAVGVRVRVMVR